MSVEVPRTRTLHSKRSFGKYPRSLDSPAYDASEEDNDPLTDDAASSVSVPIVRYTTNSARSHPKPSSTSRAKHQLAAAFLSDDGVDSPTYDGDIESSTTAGPDFSSKSSSFALSHHHTASSTSTLNTLPLHTSPAPDATRSNKIDSPHPVFISQPTNTSTTSPRLLEKTPTVPAVQTAFINPAALTPNDIQAFVKKAIEGESWRTYKINPPPVGRPVRIYADGVYDLFHFGHALQLRQAKLAFPSVYLLVGVCSDEIVKAYKARSIMTTAERCEAARHCRWVDEIVFDAPWVIDADFLEKWKIDYVAHDEVPYASEGYEDVYSLVKSQGKFIPTRRTPGVSTSELLERIVSGYRNRLFDDKLVKMGHAELRAEGSDFDESRHASANASRTMSPVHFTQ